jgi:hypothetical protein
MVALAGQRAQFTWARNEYNKTDDPTARAKYVRAMAAAIRNSVGAGFTKDEVTRDKSYPADEVEAAMATLDVNSEPTVSEAQTKQVLQNSVDTATARRIGVGTTTVYAYGYRCAPDRLKIGYTDGDVIERIADQIGTSTPDKPVLFLEVKTYNSRALEKALHSILNYREKRVLGGGDEWFRTSVEEVERLCNWIDDGAFAASPSSMLENRDESPHASDGIDASALASESAGRA